MGWERRTVREWKNKGRGRGAWKEGAGMTEEAGLFRSAGWGVTLREDCPRLLIPNKNFTILLSRLRRVSTFGILMSHPELMNLF